MSGLGLNVVASFLFATADRNDPLNKAAVVALLSVSGAALAWYFLVKSKVFAIVALLVMPITAVMDRPDFAAACLILLMVGSYLMATVPSKNTRRLNRISIKSLHDVSPLADAIRRLRLWLVFNKKNSQIGAH